MIKITILVSVMFIGMVCASSWFCDACGPECEASCGTRRFRACCFNYNRKKRGDGDEFWFPKPEDPQVKVGRPALLIRYVSDDDLARIFNSFRVSKDGASDSEFL